MNREQEGRVGKSNRRQALLAARSGVRMLQCLLLVLPLLFSGCRSMSARYIGTPQHGEKVGGLPIVLERARWLKVTYSNVGYVLVGQVTTYETVEDEDDAVEAPATEKFELVGEPATRREISFELVTAPEVYALDIKRPGGGKIDFEIEFPEGKSYPKKIKAVIEDKTLEILSEALQQRLEGAPTAAETEAKKVPGLHLMKTSESVEKIEFYDIEDLKQGRFEPVFTIE